jgi:quinol monooxygenase YgiN
MAIQDTWCSVDAYFSVKPGKKEAFADLVDRFVEETKNENGIRYYGWSIRGEEIHCRQGYLNAEGFLEHAGNVMHLFEEAMTLSDCSRLAIHGPEAELEKLREPMAQVPILEYFSLTNSFRR